MIGLLQLNANGCNVRAGASHLPIGDRPHFRRGLFHAFSTSAKAGRRAGVGYPQGPGLSYAGVNSRHSAVSQPPGWCSLPHRRAVMSHCLPVRVRVPLSPHRTHGGAS